MGLSTSTEGKLNADWGIEADTDVIGAYTISVLVMRTATIQPISTTKVG